MLPDSGVLRLESSSRRRQKIETMTPAESCKYQDKVVVVTGGGSGIGKALAIAFAQHGAHVVVVDLRGSHAVVSALPTTRVATKPYHLAFVCDVTNPQQVRGMIQQVKQRWGRIDIYCSNAGIIHPAIEESEDNTVAKHSDDQWTKILRVNVQSHVLAARELVPDWQKGLGDGVFVLTASAGGLLTQIGDASYGVSKAAAVSFAEHMAITHPTVQVHCLCPQAVDTPFVSLIFQKATRNSKLTNAKPTNSALIDGIVTAEYVADCTLEAIETGSFWIFPHEQVPEYVRRKAMDHTRWLKGMQRLQTRLFGTTRQSKL